MRLILCSVLCLLLPVLVNGQDQEKEILELLNAARTNPKKFIEAHALPYIQENGLEKNRYAKSLLQDLKETKPMGALKVAPALTDVARYHAKDMGTEVLAMPVQMVHRLVFGYARNLKHRV